MDLDKRNLLNETMEKLSEHGKTPDDVEWCGSKDDGPQGPWAKFVEQAQHINYDSGFGMVVIADDLVIVGSDWWLERAEYDGAEWWEFKRKPVRNENKRQALMLVER